MFSLKKIAITVLVLASYPVFVSAMYEMATSSKFYVGIEGGDSISTNTHFQPVITFPRSQQGFIATPENTGWTRDIGSSGFGGVLVGYEWNKNVAIQLDYTFRGNYHWNLLTIEDDALFAPDVFDRYEANNIRIQTVLADVLLKPVVDWGGFVPYIKVGIGASNNKIGQLQNIDVPTGGRPLSFNSLLQGKSTTNFAWDAGLGADYYFNRYFSTGLGYRFVDAGTLETGTRLFDTVSGITTTTSPFKAQHIYLHEVSVSAVYHFGGA